jgi:hypothetical protein
MANPGADAPSPDVETVLAGIRDGLTRGPHLIDEDGHWVSLPYVLDLLDIAALRGAGLPEGCACPPCPGRGNDGHRMTHCAECCFGTRVEADEFCPIHGRGAGLPEPSEGACPACGEDKFIGHGPVCIDCYTREGP